MANMKESTKYSFMGILLLCSLIFCLASCSNKREKLSVKEYMNYVNDPSNNLIVSKELNAIRFNLSYQPVDLMVANRHFGEQVSEAELVKEINENQNYIYCNFIIKDNEQENNIKKMILSKKEYQNELSYFSSGMQSDFYAVAGNDTLPCVMYHFENPENISPELRIALGFESSLPIGNKEIQVVFDDKVFGNGYIKFVFDKETISAIPAINTKELWN